MKYGYFDPENREYVIDRCDIPVSFTNYIGVRDMCAVISHNAGGYVFYKSPQYHRITRFRPNGVPMDRPGHTVYVRDDETDEYWSISWQPVGKSLSTASYSCRHGLSYSTFACDYQGIQAQQRLFIPMDDPVEIWDVRLRNTTDRPRRISTFSYAEFSFHHIDIDNQNFQMSLYASGSSYDQGIIEYDLYYEPQGYQYFTSSMDPTSYDCLRDRFLGNYRTETNPIAVELGRCSGSQEKTGNHCASLHHTHTLAPGEEIRLIYYLGEGRREAGEAIRAKYNGQTVDNALGALADFWDNKLRRLQVQTPYAPMNTMLNLWNLYQAEINVMFSRFASFIEVGGRTGLGYRDTAQDVMCVPHSNPEKCRSRLIELLRGLVSKGYGLHLFQPEWFEKREEKKSKFRSPTVIPTLSQAEFVHGIEDACSDDALWLIAAICEYVKETGEFTFFDEVVSYADGSEGTVYEHMTRILDFSTEQVGAHGICKGLRADWNDCLNLGGGESAMVSFLHVWALDYFIAAAKHLGYADDVKKYSEIRNVVSEICERELWDGDWYLRGFTSDGRPIGTHADAEGKVHLESNTWAVLSGVAPKERALDAMDAVHDYLYTDYGLMLNAPAYTKEDENIGFITRVYPGVKENGSIFSHPNPWAWVAESMLGRGNRAMQYYKALLPARQNDMIHIRQAEPYSYCQFIMGSDHTAHGRARHPWMTGSSGWAYFAATRYILGVRLDYDQLLVDPCIPSDWDGFTVTRHWRGAVFNIRVENPYHVEKGVLSMQLDGKAVKRIPAQAPDSVHEVVIVMGV